MSDFDINFRSKGLPAIESGMTKAAAAADSVATATDRGTKSAERAIGPHTKLAQIQREVLDARADPNTSEARYKDLAIQAGRAEAAIKRLQVAEAKSKSFNPYQYKREAGPQPAPSPATKYAYGANQRLADLQAQQAKLEASGVPATDARAKDIGAAIARTSKQIEKQDRPDPGIFRKFLGDMSWRNRFVNTAAGASQAGASGGLAGVADYGLTVLGTLGPEGKAAELFVRAIGSAAEAVDKLTDSASKSTLAFYATTAALAGTGQEAGRFKSLGPNAVGEAARLNQAITTDPVAMAEAAKYGASAIPGPYGTQDYAPNYLKVVEGLRGVKDDQQRAASARRLGIDASDPVFAESDEQFARQKSDATFYAGQNGKQQSTEAADFQAARKRADDAAEESNKALMRPLIELQTKAMNWAAGVNQWFAQTLGGAPSSGSDGKAADLMASKDGKRSDSVKATDAQADALTKNTQSNQELTRAIQASIAGGRGFGFTSRSESAFPGGLGLGHGAQLRAAIVQGAIAFRRL